VNDSDALRRTDVTERNKPYDATQGNHNSDCRMSRNIA
jgi:hypothetical protein